MALLSMSVHHHLSEFPQLTKVGVYAALAYVWDHRQEILNQMAESDAFAEQVKARTLSRVQHNHVEFL
jgi:hypothetical protein